jgi:mannosyltransferase OCH1-like enzyme
MDPKKDFKKFFQQLFDTPVDIQGEILTSEELTRKNFIIFVDNYRKAVIRSQEMQEKFGLDLWSWEDLFAKSLEGIIYYTFEEEVADVILWYIYEHYLAEDPEYKIINFGEEQFMIETSEDLYDLICLVEE